MTPPSQSMSKSQAPVPMNVILFGKWVFADAIKDIEIRPSCIRLDPKSNDRSF